MNKLTFSFILILFQLSLFVLSCKNNSRSESVFSHKSDSQPKASSLARPLDKKDIFINEGFGFSYDEAEVSSMSLFIKNHGSPASLNIVDKKNIQTGIIDKQSTLEYISYKITFYNFTNRDSLDLSRLLWIHSRPNIEYMYGINVGITFTELVEIFGELHIDNNRITLSSNKGHLVIFEFVDDKVSDITWYYSSE